MCICDSTWPFWFAIFAHDIKFFIYAVSIDTNSSGLRFLININWVSFGYGKYFWIKIYWASEPKTVVPFKHYVSISSDLAIAWFSNYSLALKTANLSIYFGGMIVFSCLIYLPFFLSLVSSTYSCWSGFI